MAPSKVWGSPRASQDYTCQGVMKATSQQPSEQTPSYTTTKSTPSRNWWVDEVSSESHTDGGHTIIAILWADGIKTEIEGTPEFVDDYCEELTLKKLKGLIEEGCVSFNSSTTP